MGYNVLVPLVTPANAPRGSAMKRALSHWLAGAAVVLALLTPFGSGGHASAQPPDVSTLRQPGAVIGTVWNGDDTPVAHARLRLRNVTTGQVVLASQADELGRFAFPRVAPGSYIVELVDGGGN